MTEKTHCGIGPIPKNQKLGTMQQCLAKKQVKYWGLHKVDPRMVEASKNVKKTTKLVTREQIILKQVTLRGKIAKLRKTMKDEKNQTEINKMEKEVEALVKELKAVNEKATQLQNVERKTSRKPSKKTSKKPSKKTSRKTSRKTSKPMPKKTARKTSRKTSRKTNKK
jgi:predicted  nucleic acid-binding Zn-ribbon protein